MDYLMRFIRVRRPVAFVILGGTGEKLKELASVEAGLYGYEVGTSNQDELGFIAGVSEREPDQIIWDALHGAVSQIRQALEEF